MRCTDVIPYKLIDKCSKEIDRTRSVQVRLSRYQATLFRTKLEMMVRSSSAKSSWVSIGYTVKFLFTVSAILLTCPQVAMLSDYYEFDSNVLARVSFEQTPKGVLVTFSPRVCDKARA